MVEFHVMIEFDNVDPSDDDDEFDNVDPYDAYDPSFDPSFWIPDPDDDYDVYDSYINECFPHDPDADVPLDDLLARLEDSNDRVRWNAMRTLSKREPRMLAQHAATVVAKLSDSDRRVRFYAVKTLGVLEPGTLAPAHAHAVGGMLTDSARQVRRKALNTLDTLDPAALAQFVDAVVAFRRCGGIAR